MPLATRTALAEALAKHGLLLRGGWVPTATDDLAPLPDGRPVAVVWMVGVAGSGFWPHFTASGFFQDGLPHPLDRWSAAIGNALASQYAGRALFPSDGPPYHPFQQWADRCEPTQASRLMLRMHSSYGLWHAYRFALALPKLQAGDLDPTPSSPQPARADLCLQCDGQPCLRACPVQAYTGSAFAVDACRAHLHTPQGQDCMQGGCLARAACPEGRDYVYEPEHAAFHMRAFMSSRI